ncbi:MAG: hypothetical protein IT373_27345 [Polyangiaceae bacterium]|nr:hypothetical protein [Polyangiaceae bacterium]
MTDLWLLPLSLREPPELLRWLGHALAPVFHAKVGLLQRELALDGGRHPMRRQVDAGWILSQLLGLPDPGLVLAVTSEDLYLPVFTYVIGEACLGGRAAVVSTHRLHEERYGMAPNVERLRARVVKEAIHEIGHCHGLVHCPSGACVMHSSSSVEDVDNKGHELCPECARAVTRRRG